MPGRASLLVFALVALAAISTRAGTPDALLKSADWGSWGRYLQAVNCRVLTVDSTQEGTLKIAFDGKWEGRENDYATEFSVNRGILTKAEWQAFVKNFQDFKGKRATITLNSSDDFISRGGYIQTIFPMNRVEITAPGSPHFVVVDVKSNPIVQSPTQLPVKISTGFH